VSSTATTHPIRLVVTDDLQRTRLTVFFRAILAIPLFLWLGLWGIVTLLAALANWVATLISGQSPEGLHNFIGTYVRYSVHVSAYANLIADPYPWFNGRPGYPIDLEFDPPAPQNRWIVFFRLIVAIPALILARLLSAISQALAVFSWFISLFTGRVPEGLRNFAALALRIETQTFAYILLLTGRYPNFNVNIDA
jgi:hypothetical protein